MDYPGNFHAPYVLLATPEKALLAAATTWLSSSPCAELRFPLFWSTRDDP